MEREAGLTRKFETSHVGGATGRTPPIPLEDPLEKEMATHSRILGASLVAQMVKNLPAMQETWV